MTDQPPAADTPDGLLEHARQAYLRAVRLLDRAFQQGDDNRWIDDQALHRAAQVATVAAAGARVAHGLVGIEHLEMLRSFEERVEARTTAFPCPDCDYVAGTTLRLDDHLIVAHSLDAYHRPLYQSPTLTGPHEITGDHWFIKEPVPRDELPVPTLGRVRFFKPGLYEVDISDSGIDRIELVSEGDPLPVAAKWRREPDGG